MRESRDNGWERESLRAASMLPFTRGGSGPAVSAGLLGDEAVISGVGVMVEVDAWGAWWEGCEKVAGAVWGVNMAGDWRWWGGVWGAELWAVEGVLMLLLLSLRTTRRDGGWLKGAFSGVAEAIALAGSGRLSARGGTSSGARLDFWRGGVAVEFDWNEGYVGVDSDSFAFKTRA